MINRLLIAGFRPYEVGIFDETGNQVELLKALIKDKLESYIENGTEWVIIQGLTGIDLYAGEVLTELQAECDVKFAVLMPFHQFNNKYNDKNNEILDYVISQANFVQYIFEKEYESPSMFKSINHFLVNHTDGALIFFDDNINSNVKYLYKVILEKQMESTYNIERIQLDDINMFVEDYFNR